MTADGRTFLLTGVTGFLGKVVLEELVRRREELRVEKVLVVIRRSGPHSAAERFDREVAASPCFSRLPPGWTSLVGVVEADLETPGLGFDGPYAHLAPTITHVIHSAASVSFDLPIQEASRANVVAALNVLDVAKRCPNLERMVAVSTAYVTPHDGGDAKVPEALAPLPIPANVLFQHIERGTIEERPLLKRSGHPNTYTLTKSIAEHLLTERRGHVPLTIVRPSIISASLQHPFPGWIDSAAAFGGFVLMLGLGHLRAVVGKEDSRLDLVPVDEVSTRLVEAAVESDAPPTLIRHAAAGHELSPTIRECWDGISSFYNVNRMGRRPGLRYIGQRRFMFLMADAIHHQLPVTVASMGSADLRRKARSLKRRLRMLNDAFPYFTSNTFDFQCSRPLGESFEPNEYVRLVCQGIHRHVLRQDPTQWVLAGDKHPGHAGDLAWSLRQPQGNLWIRLASWRAGKVFARTHESITVDIPSFEAARKAVPDGSALVLVATHRSYLDFVLVSYLAFARPDLGIPIPHIAATMEFGKIPVLGRILQAMHAFYLRRGTGREDPELTARIARFVAEGKALEFFIEGTRSRDRSFLEPKRGLLRALQATGRPVTILPVALSYDRIPEESTFLGELSGQPKPRMSLGALLGWFTRVRRGQVALGRAHIACGAPVQMAPDADVHQVSRDVMRQLRDATVTTTFHLEALQHHQLTGPLDADGLRREIERRGGRVLESRLGAPHSVDPLIAATFRHQFAHRFEGEPLLAERPSAGQAVATSPVAPVPQLREREPPARR